MNALRLGGRTKKKCASNKRFHVEGNAHVFYTWKNIFVQLWHVFYTRKNERCMKYGFLNIYFSNLLLTNMADVVSVTIFIFVSGGSGYSNGARSLVDLTYFFGLNLPSTSVRIVAVVLLGEVESMLRIRASG